jgi:hypothetical protein
MKGGVHYGVNTTHPYFYYKKLQFTCFNLLNFFPHVTKNRKIY